MSLVQLGVTRPRPDPLPGWSWAGQPDPPSASRLADFVAAALRGEAERSGTDPPPPSQVCARSAGLPVSSHRDGAIASYGSKLAAAGWRVLSRDRARDRHLLKYPLEAWAWHPAHIENIS